MRIVTRPDFDGIVCATLLRDVLDVETPIKWAEPNAVQNGLVEIKPGDVIANLAFNENCALWFDHHLSNRIAKPYSGSYWDAPSAARVVFDYFKGKFKRDYNELVKEADKIDSARLSLDEIFHPEKYSYISLDMTIDCQNPADIPYWNNLVELLRQFEIDRVLDEGEVQQRIKAAVERNKEYVKQLKEHSYQQEQVVITDFRCFDKAPSGNRFLVFCLFPEANIHVKIRYFNAKRERVIVSVGHSILNRTAKVNCGKLCARFFGGGHKGAGSCSFPVHEAKKNIAAIIDTLVKNKTDID